MDYIENARAFRKEGEQQGLLLRRHTVWFEKNRIPGRQIFVLDMNQGEISFYSDQATQVYDLATKFVEDRAIGGEHVAIRSMVALRKELDANKGMIFFQRPYYVNTSHNPRQWISLAEIMGLPDSESQE